LHVCVIKCHQTLNRSMILVRVPKRRHPMTEWVEKGFRLAVCYDATEHGERCHFSSLRVAIARRLALIDVGATSAFAWSVK